MANPIIRSTKHLLTKIGPHLSRVTLIKAQEAINHLHLGRWLDQHDIHFPIRLKDRETVWRHVLPRLVDRKVLYLEFGVHEGASIRWWANELKNRESMFHGFDSFEGLPETGGVWVKGEFDTQGTIPKIDDSRVKFFKGWFDQTLPKYTPPPHDVLFVTMDADLYSSTIYVLRALRPYFKAGSLIYFDEMQHIEHEPRALEDYMQETRLQFKPVCADVTLAFELFECLGTGAANGKGGQAVR